MYIATVRGGLQDYANGKMPLCSIDHLVETVKKETRLGRIASTPAPPSMLGAAELLSLADSICILADGLAGKEGILVRYASKLQALDLAAQVLRKLAAER